MAWAYIMKHVQVVAGVGFASIYGLALVPQTLGLSRYKSVLSNYKNGEPQAVDRHTLELVDKVLYALNLKAEEEAGVEFFTCYGNEPVHKGSFRLKSGAIIGLPPSFAYKTANDIPKDDLQVNGTHVDWSREAAQDLERALVLSDEAKAFAMARELKYTSTHHVWIDGFFKSGFGFGAFATCYVAENALQLKKRMKLWGRLGLFGIAAGLYYGLYVTASDAYYCWRDNKADTKASQMGVEYARGGVEYYTKSLERNKAMRKLMGTEGVYFYTPYGNEAATFRRAHVELTQRKDLLQKLYEEKVKNSQQSSS